MFKNWITYICAQLQHDTVRVVAGSRWLESTMHILAGFPLTGVNYAYSGTLLW